MFFWDLPNSLRWVLRGRLNDVKKGRKNDGVEKARKGCSGEGRKRREVEHLKYIEK